MQSHICAKSHAHNVLTLTSTILVACHIYTVMHFLCVSIHHAHRARRSYSAQLCIEIKMKHTRHSTMFSPFLRICVCVVVNYSECFYWRWRGWDCMHAHHSDTKLSVGRKSGLRLLSLFLFLQQRDTTCTREDAKVSFPSRAKHLRRIIKLQSMPRRSAKSTNDGVIHTHRYVQYCYTVNHENNNLQCHAICFVRMHVASMCANYVWKCGHWW